jgi:hypothetical protein
MTTGSQSDMLARLKGLLPGGWFPATSGSASKSATPILDGLLSGSAWALSFIYSLIVYAQNQTRIATATDVFLDLAASDYFGPNITRNANEPDAAFSTRIRANLLAPKATRAAVIDALVNLTGTAPAIFEPFNAGDTGAYGFGNLGYGVAGGYGSLALHAQVFITAYRQIEGGVANVGGYGTLTGNTYAPGGYCTGAIEYTTISDAGTQVMDAEIYATIAGIVAAGVIAWTKIDNPA